MNNFKRLIAFLVTACMLSSMMVFAADIDLSQESENVVTDPIYQADVAKLSALGLWTLSGEDSEQPVTRGEYAQLIVTILAMKDQKVNTPPIFRDVTSENAYCSAVSILHNLKIVSGDYGSLFRPDDAITYNEAMKMLICALGYNQYADEIGGYPIGYMMTARELGLLINNVSGNDTMTRGSVASFIINAIEVPLLKRYTYGSSASFYSKADNVTILTEYFDIYKINAVINAVGPTRINAGVKLMETVADLNGVTFNVGATNAKDYIGYNVYAYYKEDRNATRSTLLFVEPAKNTVYDLKDDEISSYDPETERLSYFTNIEQGKKSYITIRLTDNIIYNNVRTKDFTREDFETADRIRAIDNNNDGNFEAVFIENEEVFMVKSVNTSDYKIYDNYMPDGVLDIESDGMTKVITFVDRYGNEVDVSSITFGSVLNVMRSKPDDSGAMTTTAVVTNQTTSGTVSEILNEGNKKVYIIDGQKYYFAKNEKYITDLLSVKIGNTYKFYLDKNNRIAGIDISGASVEKYGFLVKAKVESALDMQPTLRIYTTDKKFLDAKLATNCVVNGLHNLSAEKALEQLYRSPVSLNKNKQGIFGKAVRYRLNANNEISFIISANPPAHDETDETYKYGSQEMNEFPLGNSNPMYLRDVGLFDGRIRINSSTTVIIVPPDEKDYDDVEKFGIGNMDTFKSFHGVDYNMIKFYDVDKERTAGLVVYASKLPGGTQIDRNTRITIVTRISSIINEDGEETFMLYGLQSGKEISVEVIPEIKFIRYYKYPDNYANKPADQDYYVQTVERGDIIRFATNAEGKLDDYEKVFDLDDEDDPNVIRRFGYEGYVSDTIVTNPDEGDGNQVPSSPTDSEFKNMDCMISISDKYVNKDGRPFHLVHHGSNKYYFYAVQFKLYYATLVDKIGGTIVFRIGPNPTSSKSRLEIAPLSRFAITVIDKSQDLIYPSGESELAPEKVVGEQNATKMIMYLAGGIPRDLIIVKE